MLNLKWGEHASKGYCEVVRRTGRFKRAPSKGIMFTRVVEVHVRKEAEEQLQINILQGHILVWRSLLRVQSNHFEMLLHWKGREPLMPHWRVRLHGVTNFFAHCQVVTAWYCTLSNHEQCDLYPTEFLNVESKLSAKSIQNLWHEIILYTKIISLHSLFCDVHLKDTNRQQNIYWSTIVLY